jgi:hypothetical protein
MRRWAVFEFLGTVDLECCGKLLIEGAEFLVKQENLLNLYTPNAPIVDCVVAVIDDLVILVSACKRNGLGCIPWKADRN